MLIERGNWWAAEPCVGPNQVGVNAELCDFIDAMALDKDDVDGEERCDVCHALGDVMMSELHLGL